VSSATLLCIAVSLAAAQTQLGSIPDRFLTNQDVIEMLKSGMTSRAVIARIHESPCKFDKSAAGLEALRAANVPYKVVLAMMQAPETPPPTKGHIQVVIPDSTPVKVALSETLESDNQKAGYIIYFHVLDDVRIRGLRVIASGARARGRLLDSRDRSRLGEPARLQWNMMDVEAVDGQRLPLRGGSEVSGTEFGSERAVVAGEGEQFIAYTYGLRKVSVLPPILPARNNSESLLSPNPNKEKP
jgi:hypothetical protein